MAQQRDRGQTREPSGRPEDSPVAWFVVLERARLDGDFARAAEAQRELRRLGVLVRYAKGVGRGRG